MELKLKYIYNDWYGNEFDSPFKPQAIIWDSYGGFYIRNHLGEIKRLAYSNAHLNDKRVVAEVLGEKYEVLTPKEMKAIRQVEDRGYSWTVRELAAYRELRLLSVKIKEGKLRPSQMPRRATYAKVQLTGPQNIVANTRRMRLVGKGFNDRELCCAIPLFDKLHNPFGFEYKNRLGDWEHTQYTPFYFVDQKDSGKFCVYFSSGVLNTEPRLIGTTSKCEKILGIAQKHFAENMLEHNEISEIFNREYMKALAEKVPTEEFLEAIDGICEKIRRSIKDMGTGTMREVASEIMRKKNEQNY